MNLLKNNLDLLSKSLETNALENVHVHPYAVAEKRTTFQLELSGSYSNCRVIDLGESTDGEDEPEITIEAFPLDERLKDCSRIDLIKMDIEGAEARAWRGMADTIQRLKPMVIFEFSPLLIRRISHIEPTTFLTEIINSGYELYAIDNLNGQLSMTAKPERIIELWERSGLAHVDLLARPLV